MYRYHEVDVENDQDVPTPDENAAIAAAAAQPLFALTPAEAEVSVSPVFAEEEL